MKNTKIAAALVAFLLAGTALPAMTPRERQAYRDAVNLYDCGMYERSRAILESIGDDPLAEGYVVLCALKTRSDDMEELMDAYERRYPSTVLTPRIRFENARLLFDDGKYGEAALEFSKVEATRLNDLETAEQLFKSGYSYFCLGQYPEALRHFVALDALDRSDYTAPGQYVSGVINYNSRQFEEAEFWFGKAVSDSRFKELCEFYIVDCEFNRQHYSYVASEGPKIFASAPAERRQRLARIISESHLVLGNVQEARYYYDFLGENPNMNRKDYFYAGTLLYSIHDYSGAIENYNKMGERRDSIGQVANYHLGNAYLRTRNQVAAMNAFKDAASVNFDPKMTEDAMFNYAKLAFDLNKDTSGFAEYLKRYSTRTRGVQIYGYMALASLYDRDYAAAIAAYDNIDELDSDMQNNYIKANFLRGQELFNSGSYRDAIPYFRTAAYYLPKNNRLNQYARYWQAEANYSSGNWKAAAELYTELYNGAALYNMEEGNLLPYNVAYCQFKLGEYDEAAKWFDNYINGGNALYREDAMNRRADCDFARRDYKAAIASYQKVLDEFYSPHDIYPYYQQAISYGLNSDRKRKISVLSAVEGASPEDPLYSEAWYELGRAQLEAKSYNDAINSFTHLHDTATDQVYVARSLAGLGLVYRNMGNSDKALDCYKQVVSLMPGSEYAEEALMAIESIYQTRKEPDKYLAYLEENSVSTVGNEEEREAMYFSTGEQLFLSSSYTQAITSFKNYLDTFPEGSRREHAMFYIAESYRATGEKEKACDYYAAAAASTSGQSFVEMSQLRYAQLSYGLERFSDALSGYRRLLEISKIDENKNEARIGMMRSAYRCKDYSAASSYADDALAAAGSDAFLVREIRYVKAKSCLALSRRDEAMNMFRVLADEASTPEGAEARYVLIQNSFDTGEFDSVEREVYAFSQVCGNQTYWLARAYIVLGDSFAERGNYSQAKATYESILNGYSPSGDKDDVADMVKMKLQRLETLMQK